MYWSKSLLDDVQILVGTKHKLTSSRFLHFTSMSLSLFSRPFLSFLSSLSLSSLLFCQDLSASFFSFSLSLSSCRASLSWVVREDTVWLWFSCWCWRKRQRNREQFHLRWFDRFECNPCVVSLIFCLFIITSASGIVSQYFLCSGRLIPVKLIVQYLVFVGDFFFFFFY